MAYEREEELNSLRHTAAHLLAAAVKDLWPGTHNAIGPAIENGFYQDFDFGDHEVSEEDLPKIEKRMKEMLKDWGPFEERGVSVEEARELFQENPYKLELLEGFAEEGKEITVNDPGNFLDLCKGGHLDTAKQDLRHFKLLSMAGAYWKGDENNQMLTRIYGTAFFSQEELSEHLERLEEAKKRDHRVLGKKLDLFAFSPLVGPGLPMFTPQGNVVREELLKYSREIKERNNYSFVHIPHVAKAALYEKSGHLGKYDAMMPTMKDKGGDELVLKAMNCPHHFELFNSSPRSYRDLPLRIAENTTVYRNEKSGELSGLLRVAALMQDDTHHFVRHEQIADEIRMILGVMKELYETFGFEDFQVQISVRDPENPDKYFGDDKLWGEAEGILVEAVKEWGAPYSIEEGEAAFYGPKIDIMVKDAIGRTWQLTTVQLDFVQPENFNMRYVGEDGKEHAPAVLHVAILGSVERFMGILIEHYAGALPLWLSPAQVQVLPISQEQREYAGEVLEKLKAAGIRAEIDDRDLTIGKRIREAEVMKAPVMLIMGNKEMEEGTVSVRTREESDAGTKTLEEIITDLKGKISERKE